MRIPSSTIGAKCACVSVGKSLSIGARTASNFISLHQCIARCFLSRDKGTLDWTVDWTVDWTSLVPRPENHLGGACI